MTGNLAFAVTLRKLRRCRRHRLNPYRICTLRLGRTRVSQPVLSTFGFIGLLSQLSDNNLRPISVHPGYSSSDLSAGFLALFSSEFRDFRHLLGSCSSTGILIAT